MTNSDRTLVPKSILCLEVRRIETLWKAWLAVRSKALRSKNRQTSDDAHLIDQNPLATLRAIQKSLCDGSFEFGLQKAVIQKRPGKRPRPIVVSPVTNRIVQRAILETLQNEKQKIQLNLGQLPSMLLTPTSVGGIPKRGAQDAVRQIRSAIDAGASYFIRSDIKSFYTKVPVKKLMKTIQKNTGDQEFSSLISSGISVEFENADDPLVKEWIDLFPNGELGVPQGSSLSTFCANVILYEFDLTMNKGGIVTIRYIDDFVVLGPSKKAVERAFKNGLRILSKLGLEAYEPKQNDPKASFGEVKSGFDFLSFRFKGSNVGLSRAIKTRLKNDLVETIRQAKASIQKSLAVERRAEMRFAQSLVTIDRKIRGWGDAFREIDRRVEFNQLDKQIDELIADFFKWYYDRIRHSPPNHKRRALGVALLADTPPRSKQN